MKALYQPAIFGLAVVLAIGVGVFAAPQIAAAEWKPKKPVEFIIMAGPGGGADKMARLMQSVIGKHKFASKPFIPKNKPGGTGAEALRYLKDRHGDNHLIMVRALRENEIPGRIDDASTEGGVYRYFIWPQVPKSSMPRFIVNMHADIKDDLRWRTGVVLEDEAPSG